MVNVFASNARLVLRQEKISNKSNEIKAIPKLLALLDLCGAIVTIDAIGCQKRIAKKICDKKADYVLGLKGNQSTLKRDVKLFFDHNYQEKSFKRLKHDYCYVDKDHGRCETRECWVTEDIGWLEQRTQWSGLRSIVMLRSTREIDDVQTVETGFIFQAHQPML